MAMDSDLEVKYARNGKVMVCSAILLFLLIIIIVLFRTYLHLSRSRRLFSRDPLPTTTTYKEERLDPSILKSLPTFTYSSTSATHRRPLHDCAVCLSEFADGDECRTLPNCNHSFHSRCIDPWFASHSNCPLCRTPVQPETVSSHTEQCSVSVSEAGEGCSSFPEPIMCPRKPLGIIVELPGAERGSDPVPGDHGFKCSLKSLCSDSWVWATRAHGDLEYGLCNFSWR